MTISVRKIKTLKYQPFIKWVGGKRGLLDQILPLFPSDFNNYFEPFVVGGAVFFELFLQGKLKNKKIFLSDINDELINTYKVVKNSPEALIQNLKKFQKEHSHEFYYEIREWDRKESYKQLSNLEKATRFIYLNKTCFNGLYRVNKKGYFNTPIGRYKNPKIVDEETILNASEALQNATIVKQSFEDVLKYVKKDDLVYFDPPYYPLNETSNFTSYHSNCFLEDEQIKLYEVFDKLAKNKVLVVESNSDTDFIKNLYKKYNIQIVNANRFINSKSNGRGKINEVLIRSFSD